nr:hypothetical protein [Bacteroidota bacterium]
MYSAFWNGIGAAFEFLFRIVVPIGGAIDLIFCLTIAAGLAYWLMYGARMEKGGHNYLSENK